MNAPVPINTLEDSHRRATYDANHWRGRLINIYAKAEARVSDALLALAPDKALPLLFSQKITRLKRLVSDEIIFQELAKLEGRLSERNALVHGEGKVWIDLKGDWLLHLHNPGRAGEQPHALSCDTIKSRHDELNKLVQRLTSKLRF